MSTDNRPSRHPQQRRDRFAGAVPPRRDIWPTTVGLALAVLFGGIFAYLVTSGGRDGGHPAATGIVSAGPDVTLPVATFADGAARFYRYATAGGREVRFFVMQSSDGVVRAAFDACDTCYRDRMGYHQQGDVMVCNKCRQTFPSVEINVLRGACNPAPLERTVVGDQLLLKAGAIERGAMYF